MSYIPTRIMIVEDQKIMLESLDFMLRNTSHITVLGTAMNGQECLDLLEEKEVDVIIMDYRMPVMDGFQASVIIKNKYPKIKILILTMYNEYKYTKKLIDIEVHGILLKDSSKDELLQGIEDVMNDKNHYTREVSEIFMQGAKTSRKQEQDIEAIHLTPREKQVLELMAEGYNSDEIGKKCNIAAHTVATHRKNIYRKTKCNTLPDIVVLAIKLGLKSMK